MPKHLILWAVFSFIEKDQNHPLSLSYTTESLTLTPNQEGVLLKHGFFLL